jgi:5'-methylthioadenosine phosphorylase
MRLGILAGSAFLEGVVLPDATLRTVSTSHGDVAVHDAADFVFIRRHGETGYRPPHRIPHHAHVLALEALGVRHAAGFASTGGLHARMAPGDIVIPDDYISQHPPPTFAADDYLHIVPAFDAGVRTLLHAAARHVAAGAGRPAIRDSGVYVQTHGPRFETAAEVRMLARYADVVGMTAASEATLCQERGIAYALLCIVDNHAHGVGAAPLTLEGYRDQLTANGRTARALISALIDLWKERA